MRCVLCIRWRVSGRLQMKSIESGGELSSVCFFYFLFEAKHQAFFFFSQEYHWTFSLKKTLWSHQDIWCWWTRLREVSWAAAVAAERREDSRNHCQLAKLYEFLSVSCHWPKGTPPSEQHNTKPMQLITQSLLCKPLSIQHILHYSSVSKFSVCVRSFDVSSNCALRCSQKLPTWRRCLWERSPIAENKANSWAHILHSSGAGAAMTCSVQSGSKRLNFTAGKKRLSFAARNPAPLTRTLASGTLI